ncbi:hypothetical protein G3I44_15190 [Halogeometricum borinquense]|uniref:Sodium/phosphate symporter n=1 Tax=Halogeometricum borinquense TaxID=60847 RepID=A0A6C0UJ60_9EURY|nr:hypothetical protein [Halogeometricum borinquense]QIB75522.1 hypothetical protein G3I44_15190 [Halogeometricum borinquense]
MRKRRRRFGLALTALVLLALAIRSFPLYLSPYPSTLDGFNYAAMARTATETGSVPLTGRADSLLFTSLFAVTGTVFDADPLYVAQPLATTIGAIICFVGAVVARRIVRDTPHLSVRPSTVATVTAGLLAVQGLFLRRTAVPDEEIVAILLSLIVAVSLHYAFRTGQRRWYGIVGLLLGIFPILHTFTSLVVGLVVTALTARHVSRTLTLRSLLCGVGLAGGFWAYIAVYYRTAATSLSLIVPYVDRITAYPGLFVAWGIVLVIGVVWIQHTSLRIRQGAYLAVIGSFFAVVILNAFTPIFPGTVTTPRTVLGLVSLLVVVALTAVASLDVLDEYRGAVLLVALFSAPAVIIGFSLTASLTPEYFATAMRAQTFLHLPILIISAITVSRWLERRGDSSPRRALRILLVLLVVATVTASAPLAFINLDSGSALTTTMPSEYQGIEFVSTQSESDWVSDHPVTRIGVYVFDENATFDPVANWLSGGSSPACPVLSQRSWTTTGAHLFPTAPKTVSPEAYDRWLSSRNVVYASNGRDPLAISMPSGQYSGC